MSAFSTTALYADRRDLPPFVAQAVALAIDRDGVGDPGNEEGPAGVTAAS